MITNLADDLSLVDRMKAALVGELERREQLLRAAGEDVQKIGQYRRLREDRPELPPLPFLVVVVDEFGELLEARPDVLDVLLSIGRTGRSLGVHLVLASQRLELGRVRGLESYLGYRICLRTSTPEDSVNVLGTRAAADLPALPGHGYLRTADGVTRFVAMTVSGSRPRAGARRAVRRFSPSAPSAPSAPAPPSRADVASESRADSDLAVLVRRACAAGSGRQRPPLWLPPLPDPTGREPLTLADERLNVPAPRSVGGLTVPVGLADLPRLRRQVPFRLDPTALEGHLVVVGAPQSGKSTVLATYAIRAAAEHSSSQLTFHVVDLGGGGLAPLAELPNVAAYAGAQDADGVRRVLLQLERIVEGPGPPARTRGAAARPAGVVPGALPGAGPGAGPAHPGGAERRGHVAMTSTRWADLAPKRLEQVSTRIELRLNDPVESQHGRVRASALPSGAPGRGLVGDGALVQIARPDDPDARNGDGPGADLSAAVHLAARQAQEQWPDAVAPRLRRLADLTADDWVRARDGAAHEQAMLLGVDEVEFAPVVAASAGLTLLAYGDPGSGRSRLLARLLADVADDPEAVRPQVYVVDYFGALLDAHRSRLNDSGRDGGIGARRDVVVAAAYGPQEAPGLIAALTDELARRQAAAASARRAAVTGPGAGPLGPARSGSSSMTTSWSRQPRGRRSSSSWPPSSRTRPASA